VTQRPPAGPSDPAAALAELLSLLDLEVLEPDLYRGRTPASPWPRLYGGHVLAQALVAACRTVEAPHAPHSLHAYFLRPGDARAPVVYDVEAIRDGRSFTTRRVLARQHGRAIFSMDASFQREEAGLEHRSGWPVAHPGDPPAVAGTAAPPYAPAVRVAPVPALDRAAPPSVNEWCRFGGPVPDDPVVHYALLAWVSDLAMLPVARRPVQQHYAAEDGTFAGMGASLDHALWFHRQPCLDDWFLAHRVTRRVRADRYLVEGGYYDADGVLLASVAQESLNRPAAPREGDARGAAQGSAAS
jgi:acyl-CoA thioesterase-2